MPTPYVGRIIPTTTSAGRMKPGDFNYFTWDSCPDTWDTATYTWDTAGVGTALTAYVGRTII